MTTKTNIEAVNSGQTEREAFKEFRAALCRMNGANTPVSVADRVMILSNATFLLDEYERAASPAPASPSGEPGMTNGDFHCPACGEVMKGPTSCGSCLWERDTCGSARSNRTMSEEPYMTTKTNTEAVALSDEQIHEIASSYMEVTDDVYVSFLPPNLDKFARALLASKPAVPTGVSLTAAQLLEALDFIAPDRATDADQLESEVTIVLGDGHSGRGYYCWFSEYPDEGAIHLTGASPAPASPINDELASMTRMFHEACAALGLIDESLGIDPDEAGGAAPILEAIAELKEQIAAPASPSGEDAAEQADEAVTLPEPFKSPLTSFGLLVRALRIVAGTTLYDMAKALSSTPATLSAVECGRKPLTEEMVIDTYVFFTKLGVLDTLHALNAARAKDSK